MELLLQSESLDDYRKEIPPIIEFHIPIIQKKIQEIEENNASLVLKTQAAFEFVRDKIKHSFDTQSPKVTINAAEVLSTKEGICFAKSHLLAALLRAMNIPTGFCYQKVVRKNTENSGFALHGLNAIYLKETGWTRLDPRGNKPGINSQFNLKKEQLAYPIRTEWGEIDYPYVFTKPLKSVINAMLQSKTSQELFYNRPDGITESETDFVE